MAKKTEKTAEAKEEIYIPRGAATEESNLFVSVNGVNYLLPKGKASVVPHTVAMEIRRARRAMEEQEKRKEALLRAQ